MFRVFVIESGRLRRWLVGLLALQVVTLLFNELLKGRTKQSCGNVPEINVVNSTFADDVSLNTGPAIAKRVAGR